MEVLFKEHAMKSNVILYILGKALLPWSLLEALWKLMMTAKYHKSTGKQTNFSPALLVIIKVNIKSRYMNWIEQWRLGRGHVRESRRKQHLVVSPPATALDRVLLSLGILSNFIFPWFWLGQFLQQCSSSLNVEKIPSCSTVIFVSVNFVHLFMLLSSKQEPKWSSIMSSFETSFYFIFLLAHKIPSNAAQMGVCWVVLSRLQGRRARKNCWLQSLSCIRIWNNQLTEWSIVLGTENKSEQINGRWSSQK